MTPRASNMCDTQFPQSPSASPYGLFLKLDSSLRYLGTIVIVGWGQVRGNFFYFFQSIVVPRS